MLHLEHLQVLTGLLWSSWGTMNLTWVLYRTKNLRDGLKTGSSFPQNTHMYTHTRACKICKLQEHLTHACSKSTFKRTVSSTWASSPAWVQSPALTVSGTSECQLWEEEKKWFYRSERERERVGVISFLVLIRREQLEEVWAPKGPKD